MSEALCAYKILMQSTEINILRNKRPRLFFHTTSGVSHLLTKFSQAQSPISKLVYLQKQSFGSGETESKWQRKAPSGAKERNRQPQRPYITLEPG